MTHPTKVSGNFNDAVVALAEAEFAGARIGGHTWREYVQTCEARLGLPWSVIREMFNRLPNRECSE